MTVNQVSVFIENRQGRLGEVLQVLKDNDVNILSISLADTTEYGLLRLIVNKPEHAKEVLLKAGFSSMLTEVLIIKVPHVAGALQNILAEIAKANVSIEYMYGLSVESNDASIVMKTNELSEAEAVLNNIHVNTMSSKEIEAL
ncbi:MAG: amino acid-binding protein [Clostridia bacterium]|nr:amino acid-binding protein [Clostridia bacterium]MBQ7226761.1 amino acid-binding protein [Clostridia bacterium]